MAYLRAALELLAATDGLSALESSSVYETEPVGEVPEQRDFLNAVARARTELGARELLAACKRVEARLGRERDGRRHGPRSIDVDLLLLDGAGVADDGVEVPHPELPHRRFVLEPLAELDSDLVLPDGRSIREALASLGSAQRVECVAGPIEVG